MGHPLITLLAESVDFGETLREVCPECEAKEKSLSISRTEDGVVLYQCFRASCSLEPGRIGGAMRISQNPPVTANKPRRVWDGETQSLPAEVSEWIQRTWGITDPPHWYYTDDYGGRIAMSIRSPQDTHRGWVLRNDGKTQPKALTFVDEGEEGISWYKTTPHSPTIIVEDIPSALRGSMYVNSVSLCGTGVGTARSLEIAKYASRPIIMALDQDATEDSFKWAKKYSLLWDDVKVLPLQKDIKDMEEDDVCKLLRGLLPQ